MKAYYKLRDEIDDLSNKLENLHQNHMACKMGCDLCCMDYSIFPLEFYSIKEALRNVTQEPDLPNVNNPKSCVFLKNHKCTIYNHRPIICRTHGLPLLYMNDDSEWELSACELNFTEFDMEEFTNENTFPQDKFNSKLFVLNKEFIREFKEKKFDEFELIPVRKLLNEF